MKKIRLDRTQGYILDSFLRENIEILNGKKPEKIARLCEKELGFGISPSTIKNTRKAMAAAGLEVWEFAPRGGNHNPKLAARVTGLEKLSVEQDKKFAVIFAKLHALQALTAKEDEDYHEDYLPVGNGDDPPSYACSEREILRDMSDDNLEKETCRDIGDLSWRS